MWHSWTFTISCHARKAAGMSPQIC
jgi:hypothetical protein